MSYSFSWLVLYAVYNKHINGINKNTYTDKLLSFIIEWDSSVIKKAILHSLSVIYGYVYYSKFRSISKRVMRSQNRRDTHDNHM